MNKRKYTQLKVSQRYKIEAYVKAGYTQKKIAEELLVSESTISRELKRNCLHNGRYKAAYAQNRCEYHHRTKPKHISLTEKIKDDIVKYLSIFDWSPEQIAHTFKKENCPMVSTEAIYLFVYENKKRGGTLYTSLRRKHRVRRKRKLCKQPRIMIKNRISIDERPAIVDTKSRIGDWEIDTIIGKNHKGAIVTITERKSRFCLAKKLASRKAAEVEKAVIELMTPIKNYVKTITSDNGKEFANHQIIANALKTNFYFAHPYSPWQRGANENCNGLIRQYIPKKSDFNQYKNDDILMIINKLNNRPRKCLDFNSPFNIFTNQNIALIT